MRDMKYEKWTVVDITEMKSPKALESAYGISEEMAEYVLDNNERARAEYDYDSEHLLVVTHAPDRGKTDGHYETSTVKFLVGREHFYIFVNEDTNHIIPRIERELRQSKKDSSHIHILYECLFQIADSYLPVIDRVNAQIVHLNMRLREKFSQQGILELSDLEIGLVYLVNATRQNVVLLRQLRMAQIIREASSDDKELLEDVYIEAKQANEMAQMAANLVEKMTGTYNNLINNRLNEIMRIMTGWTLLMTIPTVVSGFFGMNVTLPFENMHYAWVLIILMTIGIAWLIWRFLWKRLK